MTRDDGTGPGREMRTSIGHSTVETISVQGYDLAHELMGEIDFGGMLYLLLTGRKPETGESALLNAVLVALADHGLTPTALAARLTYTGAPDAIQGAVASGILGAGTVFLGVFENAGAMLTAAAPPAGADDAALDALAQETVRLYRESGDRLPGFGHPSHKQGDPRTARLHELSARHGTLGVHFRLALAMAAYARSASGRTLPLNAAGACGAVLADLGIDPGVMRGVAVVSRAAGVVGHIAEERTHPLGRALWALAEDSTTYVPLRRPSGPTWRNG